MPAGCGVAFPVMATRLPTATQGAAEAVILTDAAFALRSADAAGVNATRAAAAIVRWRARDTVAV